MSRVEFTKRTKREAWRAKTILVCENCKRTFDRGYRISAARASRPQFCSDECRIRKLAQRAETTLAKRFWSRVDRRAGDECWPWMGRIDPSGYGRCDVGGKPWLAHRVAYFLENQDGDRSKCVCHACDNRPCCNPSHLWLGTNAENIGDMDAKGRRVNTPPRGEASSKAKLTAEQALQIFHSAEAARVLASRYGISGTAVRLIKKGQNWAHVTGGRRAT